MGFERDKPSICQLYRISSIHNISTCVSNCTFFCLKRILGLPVLAWNRSLVKNYNQWLWIGSSGYWSCLVLSGSDSKDIILWKKLGCCIKTSWINSLVKGSNCKESSSMDLSTRHVGLKGAFVWHKLVGKTGTAHGQLKKLRYGQLCQHSDADWCSSPQQKETPSESFPHNFLWHYTRWCPAGNYISIPRSGEFYEFSII